MLISINGIKSGIALKMDDQIYLVVDYSHVKPGKGAAFVRVRLKNVRTDLTLEKTFRGNDRIEEVEVEEKKFQYSYRAGDMFHFMDQETFEEVAVTKEVIGDTAKYLQDNLAVAAVYCDKKIQKVLLPNFIITQIVETEPGIKGDSSKSSGKMAKVDTGATALVPLFINQGDWIKIDTRSDQYVERVQR